MVAVSTFVVRRLSDNSHECDTLESSKLVEILGIGFEIDVLLGKNKLNPI